METLHLLFSDPCLQMEGMVRFRKRVMACITSGASTWGCGTVGQKELDNLGVRSSRPGNNCCDIRTTTLSLWLSVKVHQAR